MNDQNGFGYTPIGKKWLIFITYVAFPLSALINIIDGLSIDYSTMDSYTKTVFGFCIFYGIALPLATSLLLHKKRIEGYFLAFITPLSNAFFITYIYFLVGSSNFAADAGGVAGALIIFLINYFYMKKRRFMFSHEEIGPTQFNYIGTRTALIVCIALLVITTLYSSLLQSYNAVDQQAYIDLENQSNEINEENARLHNIITDLNQENDALTYKADFVDNYVRFVTETGEKYHRYECQHLQNAPSIYYIFTDDPDLSYYSPCSDCNP